MSDASVSGRGGLGVHPGAHWTLQDAARRLLLLAYALLVLAASGVSYVGLYLLDFKCDPSLSLSGGANARAPGRGRR